MTRSGTGHADDPPRAADRPTPRWPLVLGLVVVAYAVALVLVGGADALDALASASPLLLLGAFGCQAAIVLLWPLVHRASLRAVGADLRYREALQVSMSVFSVSRSVPVGGAVGAAVGVERLTRLGIAGPVATAAAFLTGPVALTTIVSLGVVGITIAVVTGQLGPAALVAAAVVFVVLVGVLGLIVAALRTPSIGEKVIGWLGRRRRLRERSDRWREQWQQVAAHPPSLAGLGRIVGWSLLKWTVDMASLGLVFLAFGVTPEVTVLLIGFGISQLAATLPTTPGSIGVAEGGMVGAFVALGIPVALGTTVAITYRVFETWLPAVAGIPVLVRTGDGAPSR